MSHFVDSEKDPILYRIHLDLSRWHYQMDMGCHAFESEVVLYDGTLLYIENIGWEKINKPLEVEEIEEAEENKPEPKVVIHNE